MTTRVITFCNQKGGVGKSTSVGEMSTACAMAGKKVLAIDADAQQGTLGSWVDQVGEDETRFDIAILRDPAELTGIRDIAQDYDLVFIDTPGSRGQLELVEGFLNVSDFIVVTSDTGGMSLEPADRYINELVVPTGTPYSVLLTRVDPRRSSREQAAREFFTSVGKPVFTSFIREYAVFEDAYTDGVFVVSAAKRTATAHKAAGDYQQAALELLSTIATL